MIEHLRLRARLAWSATQLHPMEMSTAWIAVFIGITRLVVDNTALTGFIVWFWATMIVGGVLTLAGIIRDEFQLESMGLALMIGAFLFTGFRRIAEAETSAQALGYILVYLATAAGLTIRLHVVRKASRIASKRRTER